MRFRLDDTPLVGLRPLLARHGSTLEQVLRYGAVGGVSTVVDLAAFVVMVDLGLAVLFAAGASFTLGTLINYALCYRFVFVRDRFRRSEEVLRLFAVSAVGVGLNVLCVWLLLLVLPVPPLAAKIAAVPLVFAWNYLGRRWLVFHAHMPKHDQLHRLPAKEGQEALPSGR